MDEVEELRARVEELERRMDQALSRIGYLPGQLPLASHAAHASVAPDIVALARDGDQGFRRAILEQVERTGCKLNEAEAAVRGRTRLRATCRSSPRGCP